MRKYYWYISAYIRKLGGVVLASVVTAVIVFSLFIPRVINYIEQKDRAYIGIVGSYTLTSMPPQITQLISAGLTSVEPNGTVSPSVAERWIIEDDGKTYRFVIKKNLTWQDGKQLTTDDLQYNFKDVSVITTPNEIVFKLPEPFVPFPSVVSEPILRFTETRHTFFQKRPMPIGLGSYKVVDYSEEAGKLKEIIIDGPTQRRIYRFYLTEDQLVTAYKHGKVDILLDLSGTYDIFDWPTTQVAQSIRKDRYTAVFFDNANPLFEKNIRQALAYALPRDPNDAAIASGPISPDSWVYLDSGKTYDYDLDRALERLFSALPPEPLHFELVTTVNFQEQAEHIKKSWEEFGKVATERCQQNKDIQDKNQCNNADIQVTIRITNFPDTSNFQTMLIGQQIPPDPDQYFLWHSEQSTNFTHYKNTRIDALLEKGRTTAESEERRAIYQEFQQFFLEDAPAIFLNFTSSYQVSRK